MARTGGRAPAMRTRLPPLALAGIGAVLAGVLLARLAQPTPADPVAWWALVLLLVPAVMLGALGILVAFDPRPLAARRALAAAALLWLLLLAGIAVLLIVDGQVGAELAVIVALAAVDGAGLLALAATTPEVTSERLPGLLGRLGAVVVFAVAIVAAAGALLVVAAAGVAAWRWIAGAGPSSRLPWVAVVLVVVLPFVTFGIATLATRLAAGRTFHAQAAANRRNSLLLLVTLVGVVAATAEIIAATLTFEPVPALWAAGIAAVVGLGAAVGADRFGADLVLQTAGARPADPKREVVLIDVVKEVSLAAGIPAPPVFVIDDGSLNAFATGRDPSHAAVAVTRGILERLDREELQGVIGHELSHVRNLDTRYALYVAILVGLVALVTDGFLRAVVDAWERGRFLWTEGDNPKEMLASLVTGILVGLFLLAVALILRVAAPLFAALVQASVSREREFLADATSVELTRNPAGLERALAALAEDRDELEVANRGTQHLWFRNPVKVGSDRRPGIFSTHPSIGARIERLRRLRGLEGESAQPPATLDGET